MIRSLNHLRIVEDDGLGHADVCVEVEVQWVRGKNIIFTPAEQEATQLLPLGCEKLVCLWGGQRKRLLEGVCQREKWCVSFFTSFTHLTSHARESSEWIGRGMAT